MRSAVAMGRRSVRRSPAHRRGQTRSVSRLLASPLQSSAAAPASAGRKRYSAAASGTNTRDATGPASPAKVTVTGSAASRSTVASYRPGAICRRTASGGARASGTESHRRTQQVAISAVGIPGLEGRWRSIAVSPRTGPGTTSSASGRGSRRSIARTTDAEERPVAAPPHPVGRPAILDVRREHRRAAEADRPEREQRIFVVGRQQLERRRPSAPSRCALQRAAPRQVDAVEEPARLHDRLDRLFVERRRRRVLRFLDEDLRHFLARRRRRSCGPCPTWRCWSAARGRPPARRRPTTRSSSPRPSCRTSPS